MRIVHDRQDKSKWANPCKISMCIHWKIGGKGQFYFVAQSDEQNYIPKSHCFSITWSSTYILYYTEELKVVSIITLCSTNLWFCSQINTNLSESDTLALTMSSDCDSEDISHPSTSSTEYQNTDNLNKLSDLAQFNAACNRIKEKLRRFRRKAHRHSF